MNILGRAIVPGLILAWLVHSPGSAKEPAPTVDSVLAKWEASSQTCKTLDAKLTVWRYDKIFGGDHPTITQGRFYYESPNMGRYDIRNDAKGTTNDWSNVTEAVIWNGTETLWIDGYSRRCTKFATAQIQAFLSQPETNQPNWLSEFARRFQGPEQMFPLMLGVRADDMRKRFDLSLKEISEEKIYLKAVPKQPADKIWYREIHVIVDARSYLAVATRTISPNEKQQTVLELSDGKVNQRPADRDQLLAPDLSGIHLTAADTTPGCIMTLPRIRDTRVCFPQRMMLTSVKDEHADLGPLSKHPDRKLWLENGFAIVVVDGKYGFCDDKGRLSIRPQYDYAENFSNERAVVRVAGKYGYIDTTGQTIIKPQFDWAYAFSNRMGAVRVGDKWGIVNPQGGWVKEPSYKQLDPLVGGILAVTFDGKQGFVNEQGAIKSPQPARF